jgi:transmembrane 9 superfamily protein 2/4
MLYKILFLTLAVLAFADAAVYLPGVIPHTFEQRDTVKLYVDKITSTKTQMPYNYYSLPYCKPKKAKLQSDNLGEVLSGARMEDSVYRLEVKVPKSCEIACVRKLSRHSKNEFIKAINDEYRVHWILDNLPVGMINRGESPKEQLFSRGFPVGFTSGHKSLKQRQHYLYNHIRIIASYHDDIDGSAEWAEITTKIVGFRVEPMSIEHRSENDVITTAIGDIVLNTCNDMTPPRNDPANYMNIDKKDTVVYTYDVFWEKSDVEWNNRWDIYLSAQSTNEKIHWFSITNSVMIVLFLTAMIGMILLRTLRKDIAKYNDPSNVEEAKEESGWKLVHGDVFRPPTTLPMLFSVFVGTGLQLLTMCFSTLSFALLGLLSPANRGSLITAFIMLFVFMGSFAGYSSAVIYKMFRCTSWKTNTLMTAFFFPGVIFSIISVLNIVLWAEQSSGAIPLSSMCTLLFLWLCVSVPLVFLGSVFGYKREIATFPVRTNLIPRAIPPQSWYMHPIICWALGGILPFGAVSVELYFIMSALWLHHIYYIFGFLFMVVIVLILTCAEISILLCYFQLCSEDYRWWWNSFLSSGSCAGYIMLYAIWYNITELELDGVIPTFVYFSYMSIISFTFFLLTGTIGYLAAFWFNNQIYASILESN